MILKAVFIGKVQTVLSSLFYCAMRAHFKISKYHGYRTLHSHSDSDLSVENIPIRGFRESNVIFPKLALASFDAMAEDKVTIPAHRTSH